MPDFLRLAFVAAGGVGKVGRHFHVCNQTTTNWQRKGTFPIEDVRELCELGGDAIPAERLLMYLADKKAEFRREKFSAEAGERAS